MEDQRGDMIHPEPYGQATGWVRIEPRIPDTLAFQRGARAVIGVREYFLGKDLDS